MLNSKLALVLYTLKKPLAAQFELTINISKARFYILHFRYKYYRETLSLF